MTRPRVLVLAGTAEARAICSALNERSDQFDARASLAGRTANPQPLPLTTRVGGFGGVTALGDYLRDQQIDALVDATHPFASHISEHAVVACLSAEVPRAVLARPAWIAAVRDRWFDAACGADAAARLSDFGRCAFLALGRQHLGNFIASVPSPIHSSPVHSLPMKYVARSTETHPPDGLPDTVEWLCQRGPFNVALEMELFREKQIDVVVCRNSGGDGGYPKLAAARALGLPVLMIRRPPLTRVDDAPHFNRVADVLGWLRSL